MNVNVIFKSNKFNLTINNQTISIIKLKQELKCIIDKINNEKELADKYTLNDLLITITYDSMNSKTNADFKNLAENCSFQLYSFDKKTLMSDDYIIKADDDLKCFYLVITHSIKKSNKSYNNDKTMEELIPLLTGGNKPLEAVKNTNKDSRLASLSSLLGGGDDQQMLLSALMSLRGNNNPEQRNNIINSMIIPILSNTGPEQGQGLNSFHFNIPSVSRPIQPLSHYNQPVQPNENYVSQLVEMGFEESRSRRALTRTRNNIEAAVEMIANDEDIELNNQPSNQSNAQSQVLSSEINNDVGNNEINEDFDIDIEYNEEEEEEH